MRAASRPAGLAGGQGNARGDSEPWSRELEQPRSHGCELMSECGPTNIHENADVGWMGWFKRLRESPAIAARWLRVRGYM
jgi:hypothetical protein